MTGVSNSSVSPYGDSVLVGEGGYIVDSRGLGSANGADLLGGANGPNTHADAKPIDSSGNKVGGLTAGHDVASYDVQVRVVSLEPLDHFELVHGVALGRVDDDEVNAGLDQLLYTLLVVWTGSDGCTHEQLLVGVLGRVRKIAVLEKVFSRHEGHEVALLVDDRQLGLLRSNHNLVESLKVLVVLLVGHHQLCKRSHHLGNWGVAVNYEVGVTVGDNADELSAKHSCLGDGHTRESVHGLDAVYVGKLGIGREALRVGNEAVLEPLHPHNLTRLLLNSVVVVDNAYTPLESHGNSHPVFRDCVHRRGYEGNLKLDVAGQVGAE
mmetsp:Transcript_16030/g.25391  ORF Transcript_16030/g.25391 Transcript_16030/m.25391 type:complete len:323 (+) Transcript_16030:716-1684(+)